MDFGQLRAYLSAKEDACEETPFGPQTLVYKVHGRMFALVAWQDTPLRITLKCDPGYALILRDLYRAVQPGYYMNKRHWNTICLDGSLNDAEICALIDDSYALILQGLRPPPTFG